MKLHKAMLCPNCQEVYEYSGRDCRCPRCGHDGHWIQKWIEPVPSGFAAVIRIANDGSCTVSGREAL